MTTSQSIKFEFKAIPTLRILDYKGAVEFYVDALRFQVDWEHRFGPSEPVYMQLSKNGIVLHLSENKRFTTPATVFIETKGLLEFHKELQEVFPEVAEVSKTPWQTLQLELKDPFGNLLRFNETIPT